MFYVIENALSPKVFCEIRNKVKFQPYYEEDVKKALENSIYTVEVKCKDKTVGIGRIVGDARIVFFIKDIVVDPDYQRQGIGKIIMDSILNYIKDKGCDKAYVGLMATPNTEAFYEALGFKRRPSDEFGAGMVLFNKCDSSMM